MQIHLNKFIYYFSCESDIVGQKSHVFVTRQTISQILFSFQQIARR